MNAASHPCSSEHVGSTPDRRRDASVSYTASNPNLAALIRMTGDDFWKMIQRGIVMPEPSKSREWQDIAVEAANATNPERRTELTDELSGVMDERRKYLQNRESAEKDTA